MKLGYEKLMEENNIEEKDLSKDLIVVIREVKQLKSIIQSITFFCNSSCSSKSLLNFS
jgi:hypothetical protein